VDIQPSRDHFSSSEATESSSLKQLNTVPYPQMNGSHLFCSV